MDQYYTGYLPQGASIITDLATNHTYTLPRSQVMCFPFRMRPGCNQVVIDAANTTPFESAWVPGIRCWASKEAAGNSMTASPLPSQGRVNVGPNGFKWNFWLLDMLAQPLEEADYNHWMNNNTVYWMNVQNLQNRENYFFLRFTYHGVGTTLVE